MQSNLIKMLFFNLTGLNPEIRMKSDQIHTCTGTSKQVIPFARQKMPPEQLLEI